MLPGQFTGPHRRKGRFPSHEVVKAPLVSRVLRLVRKLNSPGDALVAVIPRVVLLVGGFLFKPRLDDGRGGEVLLVGDRLGNQRGKIKLFALRFEFAAVLVPGPPPAPGFFAMKQRDQCYELSQQDQRAPQRPPTKQPAAEAHGCAAFKH